MKTLLTLIVAGVIVVSCSGCATIGFTIDGDGIHFNVGVPFPEIPMVDYEKVIE